MCISHNVFVGHFIIIHVDGLVQERRNSTANALELHLSCINPSMCDLVCTDWNTIEEKFVISHESSLEIKS